jgi:hypothetical protein
MQDHCFSSRIDTRCQGYARSLNPLLPSLRQVEVAGVANISPDDTESAESAAGTQMEAGLFGGRERADRLLVNHLPVEEAEAALKFYMGSHDSLIQMGALL